VRDDESQGGGVYHKAQQKMQRLFFVLLHWMFICVNNACR